MQIRARLWRTLNKGQRNLGFKLGTEKPLTIFELGKWKMSVVCHIDWGWDKRKAERPIKNFLLLSSRWWESKPKRCKWELEWEGGRKPSEGLERLRIKRGFNILILGVEKMVVLTESGCQQDELFLCIGLGHLGTCRIWGNSRTPK